MNQISVLIGLMAASFFLSACSALRVEDEREIHAAPTSAPVVVYVKDFDLQNGNFQPETGILPIAPLAVPLP